MKKQKNRNKITPQKIIILLMLAGLIIVSIFIIMNQIFNTQNSSSNSSEQNAVSIEEDPIKSKDPANTDNITDNKDVSSGADKPDAPTTNPDTGLKNATVEITDARSENSQVSASGQVTNISESTGTCTYVFTNSATGKTITETTNTLPSSSYTVCSAISLPTSNFSTGTWNVVLRYQSTYSEGESTNVTLKID